MAKEVLVAIADGIEEIETACVVDVLRRAGATVTVASVNELMVMASRGLKIVADKLIGECEENKYDLIVLPGGMPGAEHLRDCQELQKMLIRQNEENRLISAICASPAVVLNEHGLLGNRKATCHPAFSEELENDEAIEKRVVVDGNCITSRGPGTALEFALELVRQLYDEQKAKEVAEPMLINNSN